MLIMLMLALLTSSTFACDAGVFWGANCSMAKAASHDPACSAAPLNSNATTSSTTLIWNKMQGGRLGLGGDVFLSTTLNMGCGGGYYGSQMHWNTSALNMDWAIWDIAGNVKGTSTKNTVPITPVNKDGKPVNRQGKLCSTVEPPPAGLVSCACTRYGGEGFGTHCGLGAADGYLWELGTPYTLNISLLDGNASGALFGATITNEKTLELIEVGQIYTKNPGPDKSKPQGYDCNRMIVGGGSFQEYYDGGNFTSWATISGPRFRGVAGQTADIVPTGIADCRFFGNCSGGYGGCHNETTIGTLTGGHKGLPAVHFNSGEGTSVEPQWIPPWYHWAAKFNADGSAGPDGGALPLADASACDFLFHTNREGGENNAFDWQNVPYGGSQPTSMPPIATCNAETAGVGKVGECSRKCCAYCLGDKDCAQATLIGNGCHVFHPSTKTPFVPWAHANNKSAGITTILPKR